MSATESEAPPLRALRRLIAVEPNEIEALAWAWLYIFSVLMSYYIMRPIRDEMGVAGGVKNLPWLFTGTLIAMLVLNVPFGALVRALPRVQFIAITYRFFAFNILVFAGALWAAGPAATIWIGPRLLHLDLGLQPVRRLGLLGDDGRRVRFRAEQTPVRLHRGRRDARRHRRARRSSSGSPATCRRRRCSSPRRSPGSLGVRRQTFVRLRDDDAARGGDRGGPARRRHGFQRLLEDLLVVLSFQHGDVPAAVFGDLDVPLFRDDERRRGSVSGQGRAHRVLRADRPRRERADARRAALFSPAACCASSA